MLCYFKDNNLKLYQIDRDLRSTIALVCLGLASHQISALKKMEEYLFWMDLIISRKASNILGGTLEPALNPYLRNIRNWRTLVFQLFSCSNVIRPEEETSKTENLLPKELIAPQMVRIKEDSVHSGTPLWISDSLEERQPVTSSTPIKRSLLLQSYYNKRTSGNFLFPQFLWDRFW